MLELFESGTAGDAGRRTVVDAYFLPEGTKELEAERVFPWLFRDGSKDCWELLRRPTKGSEIEGTMGTKWHGLVAPDAVKYPALMPKDTAFLHVAGGA